MPARSEAATTVNPPLHVLTNFWLLRWPHHRASLLCIYTEAEFVTTTRLGQEILQLAQQRSAALVQKDSSALQRLLADEFRYINASGMVLTRSDYLRQYVEPPDVRWIAQDLDECAVQIYGQTAVLTCRVHDQAQFGTEPFDAYYRSFSVWVRQHGIWRCAIGQTTAISGSD